jgi:hypothetical protein
MADLIKSFKHKWLIQIYPADPHEQKIYTTFFCNSKNIKQELKDAFVQDNEFVRFTRTETKHILRIYTKVGDCLFFKCKITAKVNELFV